MNQSIWERRQAVASRLEGHAHQEQGIRAQLTTAFAAAALRLEDVDPHGHLEAAVTSLSAVAANRPGFDAVLVAGTGGHGVRVQADTAGTVRTSVVAVSSSEPEPQAVASELASLLWKR